MNIRSFTVGAALPTDSAERGALIGRLGEVVVAERIALEGAGYTVQTTRLAAQPLERWLGALALAEDAVAEVGRACGEAGLDYFSLGTIQAASEASGKNLALLMEALPDLLVAVPNAFGSIQVGERRAEGGVISLAAVKASARIIRRLAGETTDGFGNLRFAAAANCPPHVPFFPAAYYEEDERNGGGLEFGLALEAADLAVTAFETARNHDEARENLLALLVEQGSQVAEVCGGIASEHGYHFTGLDISMAPYPTPERSIGAALEMVSGVPLGAPGTLAAATFVTDVLAEARRRLPTVGYSGLMLPVLEDSALATRASEGLVSLDTLLLMSSVCGLGLDTVPLPGDISLEGLERIVLDMASLAVKLDKPLTARLMPVPGKAAGEPAEWPDFPYFARGRVMGVAVGGSGKGVGLMGEGWLRFG